MTEPHRVLLISGSLRAGSTHTAVLRTAQVLAPENLHTALYQGLGSLPHFNPDDDAEPLHPAVADLRAQLGAADALLFSTPEYAGALPGSFKNLLDWTVGGGETYGTPAGWINAAGPASPTGAEGAHASLRQVLGYTGTVLVEAACVRVPVLRHEVGEDGLIADPVIRERIGHVLAAIAHSLEGEHDAG